jgi:replicative DNA helicase
MERAGKRISDVAARTPGPKLTADTLGESLELAGGLDAILNSRRGVVPTPLPSLTQEMAGGFSEGELIVLAARPKLGKSAFALQCGVHAAQRGQSVQMFSLEMSRVSNLQRLYSAQSGVPLSLIRGGWLDTLHLRAIAQAAADSEQWPLVIEDRIGSLNGIMQSIRQKRPQLAIIDYLGLITPPARNFGTRNNEISFMTRQLKMLAGEVGIPILLLAQLNREVEHEKRSPRLSDLRDSGSIEQDADVVLFLHRRESESPIELVVGVQRNGPGGRQIPMYWEGNTCRFQEMGDRNL